MASVRTPSLQSPQFLQLTALSMAVSIIGGSAYHVASEWLGGASVGKAILGLRVKSVSLGPCSFRGAVVRTAAYYVDGFLFGAVAFSAMCKSDLMQRLGDRWGGTVVVKASSLPAGSDNAGRLVLGCCVGLALWGLSAGVNVLMRSALFP